MDAPNDSRLDFIEPGELIRLVTGYNRSVEAIKQELLAEASAIAIKSGDAADGIAYLQKSVGDTVVRRTVANFLVSVGYRPTLANITILLAVSTLGIDFDQEISFEEQYCINTRRNQ